MPSLTIANVTISGSITVDAPRVGEQAYTTSGTYTWTAPVGVNSVCVGGGGAGATNVNAAAGGRASASIAVYTWA